MKIIIHKQTKHVLKKEQTKTDTKKQQERKSFKRKKKSVTPPIKKRPGQPKGSSGRSRQVDKQLSFMAQLLGEILVVRVGHS